MKELSEERQGQGPSLPDKTGRSPGPGLRVPEGTRAPQGSTQAAEEHVCAKGAAHASPRGVRTHVLGAWGQGDSAPQLPAFQG